jgi:hypothetical protein
MKWNVLDLIIVFLFFIIVFLIIQNYYSKEGFTSRIREMYRPYIRNARLFKEKTYNQLKNNFFSFIRKIGLI